jgi:tRNA-dihydrouridine synthase B
VARILEAAVGAMRPLGVPVTLKMRTGWSPAERNAVRIARLARDAGIAALAVHGRTRACGYGGQAEYDTIRAIKAAVDIPVLANGDIRTPAEAHAVLATTGADGIMIGRIAQGRPWVFREMRTQLCGNTIVKSPGTAEVRDIILAHLDALHCFYGERRGIRTARKHLSWYLAGQPGGEEWRRRVVRTDSASGQLAMVGRYFEEALAKELAA